MKAVAARRWDDYYPGGQWLYFAADHDGEKLCLQSDVERLSRYLTHDVGCKANDLDYLDHTPCTCGLRALYNPKGTRMPEDSIKPVSRPSADVSIEDLHRAARTPKQLTWIDKSGDDDGWQVKWRGNTGWGGCYIAKAVREGDMVLCSGRYYRTLEEAKEAMQTAYEISLESCFEEFRTVDSVKIARDFGDEELRGTPDFIRGAAYASEMIALAIEDAIRSLRSPVKEEGQ